jgi:hypothetical protein
MRQSQDDNDESDSEDSEMADLHPGSRSNRHPAYTVDIHAVFAAYCYGNGNNDQVRKLILKHSFIILSYLVICRSE